MGKDNTVPNKYSVVYKFRSEGWPYHQMIDAVSVKAVADAFEAISAFPDQYEIISINKVG